MAPQADSGLIEMAHACADAINRDDVDDFLRWVHPDVEFSSMIAEAEGETFRGHDGVRHWWASIRDAFEEVRWSYLEVHPSDDGGVSKLRIDGTLSGVELSQTMWQAVILRDHKAIWWALFRTEAEALQAVDARGDTA